MPKQANPAAAAAREAGKPTKPDVVTFEFKGHKFTVPAHRDNWSTKALLQLNRARNKNEQIVGIEIQLGPEAWEKVVEELAPTGGDFDEFVDLFFSTVNKLVKG